MSNSDINHLWNVALWFILIFFAVIFLLGIANVNEIKETCKDNRLKFSWGNFNCYEDTSTGIVEYGVTNVGFWNYKLNKIPIVKDG